ncbi:cytochrome c biogenesis protein ResB [Candidatus Latescibacterota bacterium]
MKSEKKKSDPGFLQTISSLQFSLVVLTVIAIVAIVGTLIPQDRQADFYQERYGIVVNFLISVFRFDTTYRSPLFLGLLGLFGLNLIFCSVVKFPVFFKRTFRPDLKPSLKTLANMPVTVSPSDSSLENVNTAFRETGFPLHRMSENRLYGEKGRMGYLGAFTVHLSLLILLFGGIISLITGIRGHIILRKGETADSFMISEGKSYPLGFEIQLEQFDVQFYEQFPGRPKSYISSVTVTLTDSEVMHRDIRVNKPLIRNNFTIYQSSYGENEEPIPFSSIGDAARVAVLLKGAPETMPPVVTLDMVFGEEYTIPGFGDSITVSIAELYRNFKRGDSNSNESNPAVKIDVKVDGEQRWSIFAFKNFPGLNMPMHEDILFLFSMLDIKTSGDDSIETSTDYYTVLGVVKDRGTTVMGLGAVLLIFGLFLSFYLRPRRIWVLEENGKITIGGTVKGDPESFRIFVRKTAGIPHQMNFKGVDR